MAHVLIVEDDREIGDLMLMLLEGMGHRVDFANSGSGALRLLSQAQHDVIFTDVHMRPMDGLELIASVKKSRPQVVFVFISGDNNPDLQDRAMQLGALEFLHKPIKVDELRLVVARALKRAERERAAVDGSPVPAPPAPVSRPAQSVEPELEGFFPGKAFAATRRQLAQFSAHNRHALIEAPSGMLDDELLRFLHGASAFAAGALSIQDAAAAPIKSLDELFAPVEGGLLVLRNLEAMPIKLQHALTARLRASEGMRVVATTCQDPDKLMVEGKLAPALYSRLAPYALRLPALAELEAELPEMFSAAVQRTAAYPFGGTAVEVDAAAAQALRCHPWPENVTELLGAANWTAARLTEPRITPAQLPEHICGARLPSLDQHLRTAEAHHVQRAVRVLGSAQGAAEALGISAAELETYQAGGATEPLFVLKRQLAAPPPPPVAESVLLVAGDEVVRHAAVAALMTGGVEVIGVGDGLAAVSALILSPRAIAVVIVIPPMPLFAADELGAQLARLRPGVRLWLLGNREPSSTPTPFHKVGPPFRSAADFEELVNPAVPSHATRPAA